jgi:hypothetical protein
MSHSGIPDQSETDSGEGLIEQQQRDRLNNALLLIAQCSSGRRVPS